MQGFEIAWPRKHIDWRGRPIGVSLSFSIRTSMRGRSLMKDRLLYRGSTWVGYSQYQPALTGEIER